ncbi:MAG: hypothetical protein A3F72_04575 [Bacteroidetes bacterium RIFCSPLOWO2_12_FULL_35_15]|nr:MAG: hypothetical protein A3F72_04575 [Bacteroidetes bacterium RIFCSPLOWO2_12_FULL_35_15]
MKKIIFSSLFLFLLACQNNPSETNDLPESNNAPKDYAADSMAKWTRNVVDDYVAPGDTTNFTDANNLKQGKWLTIVHGKVVKTQYYKDGKLVKGC